MPLLLYSSYALNDCRCFVWVYGDREGDAWYYFRKMQLSDLLSSDIV